MDNLCIPEIRNPRPGHWLPKKARTADKLSDHQRLHMNNCCLGISPWPLVFLGDSGTGKTCAGLLLVDFYGGVYYTVADWCKRVSDAMHGRLVSCSGYPISESDVWKEWERASMCVLDEMGIRGDVSDHHYETVKRCIDSRIDENKPLVCISNLTLAELMATYDDRITSRLNGGMPVHCEGADQRDWRSVK